MSDQSESGSESGGNTKYSNNKTSNHDDDQICRDFLRNVCKRGKRCRYRHPPSEQDTNDTGRGKSDYTFCHDFQNTGCRRVNCKFLHCTREEEEHFKQTGQLPVRLQQAAALGIGVPANNDLSLLSGEIPICKDYLKGNCKRGGKCKYRHVNASDYEYELRKSDHRNNNGQQYDRYDEPEFDRFDSFEYSHSANKRRRTERDFDGFGSFENRFSSRPISYQLLEEENAVLCRKVEDLKKQVADLTATNEVLLEQNARYRVSRTNLGANAAAPQSLNHLATSLAQQIALNSELASQHALQQRLARELAPAAAAAGALTGVNPASIVPVSLSQNNLTGVQQTASQGIHQQAASTTLVSYPIVSQNLRMASSMAH